MTYPAFQEHEDSPEESGSRAGEFDFTRIFLTAWEDRWQFIAAHYTSGPFGLPASYSSYWPGVLADKFRINRLVNKPAAATITDPNTQQLEHTGSLARITITYSPLQTDQQQQNDPGEPSPLPAGTWATYSQTSNVEFRTEIGRSMMWESDSTRLPPDVSTVVPESATQHTVTWHQIKIVPWVTLGNMKGCVNQTACRLPGSPQVFRPETLLFDGLDDEVSLSFDGQFSTRKLTLKFIEKAQKAFSGTAKGAVADSGATVYGWNHQWRPDAGQYDKIRSWGLNQNSLARDPMFQLFEFNNLWSATT
jgi:hypothetical protein